jgi:alpha-tubulin suppressor-like RCC1 family protein
MFTEISAGSDFTCATINSMVSCWGNNANGRTGRTGVTTGNTLVPTAVSNTYFATKVTAGSSHACALLHGNNSRTNGNVWCWGNAANGRVGNNVSSGDYATPVLINGGDNSGRSTIGISAGSASTCAVGKGTIQCWGSGANGRLGHGGTTQRLTPNMTNDYKQFQAFVKGPTF